MIARLISLFALAMFCMTLGCGESKPAATGDDADLKVTGPYTHENLSIFLIHGPDRLKGKVYLTLGEALEQKKAVMHETGNVNELAIENQCDQEIYVQSGDIVKGGRQDRTIAQDFIVPPRSGKMPIAAFCVESGRWQARAGEPVAMFALSDSNVASKSLKLAAKGEGDQGSVWREVANLQTNLAENVGGSVQATTSPSSLQLSLESGKVKQKADDFVKALEKAPAGKGDVVGYAFSINGKLNSADVYVSNAFFNKLWPRLLKASAVEAVSQLDEKRADKPATVADVKACLAAPRDAKSTTRPVNDRTTVRVYDAKDLVMFETRDDAPAAAGEWIHRNYLTRDPNEPRQPVQVQPVPSQQDIINLPGNDAEQQRR